jgi:hypothetical protein
MSDLIPLSGSRDLTVKQGRYDQEIEVYRNREVVQTYLSTLKPGEPFCFAKDVSRWFVCVGAITKSRGMWGETDPSFLIPGLEIYQTPPRVDRTPRLEKSPERSTERKALVYDDVLDVEFKDDPSPL